MAPRAIEISGSLTGLLPDIFGLAKLTAHQCILAAAYSIYLKSFNPIVTVLMQQ
jgi:hypothetical protein